MIPKALLRINCQSFSDIITNSSSEIFCQIRSKNDYSINAIATYLNSILPARVTPSYDKIEGKDGESLNTIDFWCELGAFSNSEYVPDMFTALLNKVLGEHFEEGIDYIIETNVDL